MDEYNLLKYLNYEMMFVFITDKDWRGFIFKEVGNYSNGTIDNRFNFDVVINLNVQPNGEYGFFDITSHNKYTTMMLKLNKIAILRYHKIEKLKIKQQ